MNNHHFLPPSSAGVWGKPGGCTAWPMMNATYPQLPRIEAMEGDASHQIGAELIDNKTRNVFQYEWKNYNGKSADNGIMYTEEMFECAQLYAEDVGAVMIKTGVFGGQYLLIEEKINIDRIFEGQTGSPDCVLYDFMNGVIYIWDYKFGHEKVEQFENWQCIDYMAGVLERFGIDGLTEQKITVKIRICQPRAYHAGGAIREWSVLASTLRGYHNILEANAAQCMSNDAVAQSGSHCKHCPGRHACDAALTAGIQLYEAASAPMPVELSPQALGLQLTLLKRAQEQINLLVTGYEQQVETSIRRNKLIPGWGQEATHGSLKWSKPISDVIAMANLFDVNISKDAALTPKQAIKAGLDPDVVTRYSHKPRTGMKIVQEIESKTRHTFS